MPIWAKATASPSRTVMRRFSEASAMVAPPVHDFDGAFQTMVVSEASTSPATFSRTVPSPPKQRTKSRPPSAPLTSQCASANSLACVQSTTKAKPFCASSGSPPAGRADPVQPVEGGPARVVAAVPGIPDGEDLQRRSAAP